MTNHSSVHVSNQHNPLISVNALASGIPTAAGHNRSVELTPRSGHHSQVSREGADHAATEHGKAYRGLRDDRAGYVPQNANPALKFQQNGAFKNEA